MDDVEVLSTIFALVFGTVFATVLMIAWLRLNNRSATIARTLMREAEGSITFLFDDEQLIDQTPRAKALMSHSDGLRSDWENLLSLLSGRFPHLRSQCRDLATTGKKSIMPEDGQHGWIEAEYWNGLARFTLIQGEDHPDTTIDPLTANAMEHELNTLRSIGEDSPQLIWKHDAEGVLVWANRAYIEMSEALHSIGPDQMRPWPPHSVFGDTKNPVGAAPLIDLRRVDIPDSDVPIWFEVTSLRRGTDTIHFAVDASAVVAAQDARRTLLQTMTKTFAELSVGLAIFDEDRRLVIFNPALVDLTNLPTDFLIGRPTLFSLLDRLRDHQMIPEPKNYATWRDQVAALEYAATQGNYHENWQLPNGQTFRVTGKPHPDGAIAVLFEDISGEVSLARKYRSQIDTATAVIDNLASSIAVFSPSGTLILANEAYRHLWGSQFERSLSSHDFLDELKTWQTMSAPSPVWHKLERALSQGSQETRWNGFIWLDNSVELNCHYATLPDGNHQIMFVHTQDDPSANNHKKPVNLKQPHSNIG